MEARSAGAPSRSGSIAARSLTPLLDTLFLLIFALLSMSDARKVEQDEEVRVRLPEVERAEGASAPNARRVVLQVDAAGAVRVVGDPATLETRSALDGALAQALTSSGLPEEVTVEIRADRDAPHGVVVDLLQHLRLSGFVDVELLATGAALEGAFGGDER